MTWGGRPSNSDYFLHEQDFLRREPNYFDIYTPPCDWSLGANAIPSAHIETWRINAQNMSRQFSAVYGAEHLSERLAAVEDLMSLHVREPRKFYLPFVRGALGELNYRRVQALKDLTNTIMLYDKVERPTFGQLEAIGMTIDPVDGHTIFKRPDAFFCKGSGGIPKLKSSGK